jgi:hypothetical protein
MLDDGWQDSCVRDEACQYCTAGPLCPGNWQPNQGRGNGQGLYVILRALGRGQHRAEPSLLQDAPAGRDTLRHRAPSEAYGGFRFQRVARLPTLSGGKILNFTLHGKKFMQIIGVLSLLGV